MTAGWTPISLPYGRARMEISVPAGNLLAVASPLSVATPRDVAAQVRQALRGPLGTTPWASGLRGGEHLLLLVDDNTRPTPVDQILPTLLEELEVERKRVHVTILIALGTHRKMTPAEICTKVGLEVANTYTVLNHDWDDEAALVDLGTTANGTPIRVNRLSQKADLCLGIGSILPHNLAGWSGGGKIVQPGICGKETTYATHLLAARCPTSNLGKPRNPVRSEIDEVARRAGLSGVVNTVLDRDATVAHVVAGEPRAAYQQGVELARGIWEVPVPALADIVIVSSYPADIDFWQANKALYAAERVVKRGGDIILVTPCPEGLSSQREHVVSLKALEGVPSRDLFHGARRRGLGDYAALCVSDVAARCRELAWTTVVSDHLTADDVAVLGLRRAATVDEALARAFERQGAQARIIVLTHGGEMVPVLAS
ncbi:MAG TPA: nickel-dependent lactate racemase [Anaerolineae bacterium]|nr:nickel-dependent lactate racemase [Anaerolineae bacterium]HOQ98593.1 nickel-dependent lactate racemase [Anaerolineae bacterium]